MVENLLSAVCRGNSLSVCTFYDVMNNRRLTFFQSVELVLLWRDLRWCDLFICFVSELTHSDKHSLIQNLGTGFDSHY